MTRVRQLKLFLHILIGIMLAELNELRRFQEELEEKLEPGPRAEPRDRTKTPGTPGEGLRALDDAKLIEIKELLKEAYRPGHRQYLVLYLSGWLAKARVHPLSAVKLAKMLYEETRDKDPLKTRLSAVVYSYKKAGIDIDKFAAEIESETGVKPYGLEKEIREDIERVSGKSGIQEILESALEEERALDPRPSSRIFLGSECLL